jgi:hypothetical protein
MAKKERNRGSVDRARAKRGSGQANQEPEMRFMDVPAGMPAGEPAPTRPTPRPARGSNLAPTSTRDKPVPRPAGLAERADLRKAMDSSDAAFRASKREAADREMGMKAGGKVKKMAYGGKVKKMKDRGFPDLNKDGKVTKADILQGRGVKKMAMGGKCRGMGAATRGGNYSRG